MTNTQRFLITLSILGLSACTNSFKAKGASQSALGLTSPTPLIGNQWNATSIASSSCSGVYQVVANGTEMVLTIFAGSNGQFSGIASNAGNGNQAITGTCSNGQMAFSISEQQYTGTYQ